MHRGVIYLVNVNALLWCVIIRSQILGMNNLNFYFPDECIVSSQYYWWKLSSSFFRFGWSGTGGTRKCWRLGIQLLFLLVGGATKLYLFMPLRIKMAVTVCSSTLLNTCIVWQCFGVPLCLHTREWSLSRTCQIIK